MLIAIFSSCPSEKSLKNRKISCDIKLKFGTYLRPPSGACRFRARGRQVLGVILRYNIDMSWIDHIQKENFRFASDEERIESMFCIDSKKDEMFDELARLGVDVWDYGHASNGVTFPIMAWNIPSDPKLDARVEGMTRNHFRRIAVNLSLIDVYDTFLSRVDKNGQAKMMLQYEKLTDDQNDNKKHLVLLSNGVESYIKNNLNENILHVEVGENATRLLETVQKDIKNALNDLNLNSLDIDVSGDSLTVSYGGSRDGLKIVWGRIRKMTDKFEDEYEEIMNGYNLEFPIDWEVVSATTIARKEKYTLSHKNDESDFSRWDTRNEDFSEVLSYKEPVPIINWRARDLQRGHKNDELYAPAFHKSLSREAASWFDKDDIVFEAKRGDELRSLNIKFGLGKTPQDNLPYWTAMCAGKPLMAFDLASSSSPPSKEAVYEIITSGYLDRYATERNANPIQKSLFSKKQYIRALWGATSGPSPIPLNLEEKLAPVIDDAATLAANGRMNWSKTRSVLSPHFTPDHWNAMGEIILKGFRNLYMSDDEWDLVEMIKSNVDEKTQESINDRIMELIVEWDTDGDLNGLCDTILSKYVPTWNASLEAAGVEIMRENDVEVWNDYWDDERREAANESDDVKEYIKEYAVDNGLMHLVGVDAAGDDSSEGWVNTWNNALNNPRIMLDLMDDRELKTTIGHCDSHDILDLMEAYPEYIVDLYDNANGYHAIAPAIDSMSRLTMETLISYGYLDDLVKMVKDHSDSEEEEEEENSTVNRLASLLDEDDIYKSIYPLEPLKLPKLIVHLDTSNGQFQEVPEEVIIDYLKKTQMDTRGYAEEHSEVNPISELAKTRNPYVIRILEKILPETDARNYVEPTKDEFTEFNFERAPVRPPYVSPSTQPELFEEEEMASYKKTSSWFGEFARRG